MKNLIISLILILTIFKVSAQRLSPCEHFLYVEFLPAKEYLKNHKLNQVDRTKLKSSLLTVVEGYINRKCLRKYDTIDLVLNPIVLEQTNFNNKIARGFKLLNIKLSDTISFENLKVKYAEAKWFQSINKIEKAESIYSFIESLEIQNENLLRFIHASRLRLAQIKLKKGFKNEALDLLYKVNDNELLEYSPDLNYDSNFDYPRIILGYDNNGPYYQNKLKEGTIIEPSKRLINHILETDEN